MISVKRTAIGIDLGTTYCCVAAVVNGKVEVFVNEEGEKTTPSYVAFTTDQGRLIGNAARQQAPKNARNTIYDSKRIIGRNMDDPAIQADMKLWPFKVEDDSKGKPVIHVEDKLLHPEEISAMLLAKMKSIAERSLGCDVNEAVITVPAYFTDAQRRATQAAGTIAGLKILRMINEPTAAGIAYGLDKAGSEDERTILVYDFGGGTLDVSIMRIEGGFFEVLATDGDCHLGGQDIDARLVKHFAHEFEERYHEDITNNRKAIAKLQQACEGAKRVLSSESEAKVHVASLYDDIDFESKLSRARFDEINRDLYDATMKCVTQCLDYAKQTSDKIDEVIMVGGSSRIPKLQKMMAEVFTASKINTSVNPDEAIAYGAAIQAAALSGSRLTDDCKSVVLLEVAALSLGVEVEGGIMSTVIKRHSSIPIRQTEKYTTAHQNQTTVRFKVFEGERTFTTGNVLLGEFTLAGITPAPRGVAKFDVTFDISCDGVLVVSAVDNETGQRKEITIENHRNRLTSGEIGTLIENAQTYAKEDEKRQRNFAAWRRLQHLVDDIKAQYETATYQFSSRATSSRRNKRTDLLDKCDAILEWLLENKNLDKDAYDEKYQELRQFANKS